MPAYWTCPQGHQWEIGEDSTAGERFARAGCPICGSAPATPPPPQHILPTYIQPASGEPPATAVSADGAKVSTDPITDFALSAPGTDESGAERSPHGRFRVLRVHAKGGLGKVSIAVDQDLQREVALKEIRNRYADDPQNRSRFLTEATITGRLEHPGIVPVYALGHDAHGRPYYAMKLVHGKTLHNAIRDYHSMPTPLEFRAILRRFIDVCQATAYAHSQGVVHRDLKPANIMLGEYGETLVLDWGLAKRFGTKDASTDGTGISSVERPSRLDGLPRQPDLTVAGQVLGTPAYMSPEQAGSGPEQVGPASDIYALGAILYEFLTGRPPYDDLTTMELFDRKRRDPPPSPSRIAPSTPKALEAICGKAMARAPADRYPSAAALAQDVERWLADEAVSAYAEPIWGRLARWARRRKTLVAAAGVLLVVVTVGLAISNELIRRKQQETDQARERAVDERNRALGRFQIANDTLDRMLKRMGHNRLALVTQMDLRGDAARWGLLLDAQRFYEEFVKEQSDDPGLRREMALAYRRIGDINKMKGDHAAAERFYQQALASLESISDQADRSGRLNALAECHHDLGLLYYLMERPGDAEKQYRAALARHEEESPLPDLPETTALAQPARDRLLARARTHHQFALALRDSGHGAAALEQFQQAGHIREQLWKGNQHDYEIWRSVAQTHIDHAFLLANLQRDADAEALARRSVDLLAKLVGELETLGDAHPDLAEARHEYAGSLNNLGFVLARSKAEEAEKVYQESLQIRRRLVAGFRTRPDFRYELAVCRLNLGVLFFETKRGSQAEEEWGAARKELEKLLEDFSDVPLYASRLGTVLYNLAALRDRNGDLSGARTLLDAAIAAQRRAWQANRRHPEFRKLLASHVTDLADIQRRLGLHVEAARACAELPEIAPEGGGEYLRAAGILAGCFALVRDSKSISAAERERAMHDHAAQAMAVLRAGRTFLTRVEVDAAKELEPLRLLPEFRRLRDGLPAGNPPP